MDFKGYEEVLKGIANAEQVEVRHSHGWVETTAVDALRDIAMQRYPAEHMRTNKKKVVQSFKAGYIPKPMTEMPKTGERIWYVNLQMQRQTSTSMVQDMDYDLLERLLEHGLLHRTREGAEEHAKTLLKINKGINLQS